METATTADVEDGDPPAAASASSASALSLNPKVNTTSTYATGNTARHPCSIPVDGLHKQPAFGQYWEGVKIIQEVTSSYQPTIGGSTPPHLMTNSRDFQQNVPNKTYPKYHE